jgi:hypothetical protein
MQLTSANPGARRARIAVTLATAGIVVLAGSGVASAGAQGVGAGVNRPRFDDWSAAWTYRCTGEGNFKVAGATIRMWSNGGNRVKGFQFKYRVVPQNTGLHLDSNWSSNVHTSFSQGSAHSVWMKAGPQGQAWNPAGSWALELKLKYPRSLRTAWRFKYKKAINSPDCGGAGGSVIPGQSGGARSAR